MILEKRLNHKGKIWENTREEVEFFHEIHPPKIKIGQKINFRGVDVQVVDMACSSSATGPCGFMIDPSRKPSIVDDFKYSGYWIVYFDKTVPTGYWDYTEPDKKGNPTIEHTDSSTDTVVYQMLRGEYDDTIPFADEIDLPLLESFSSIRTGRVKKTYKKGGKVDDETKKRYIEKIKNGLNNDIL